MRAFENKKKTTIVVVSATMLVVFALFLLSVVGNYLPYGIKHFQMIRAVQLSSEVAAWKKNGGKDDDLALLESTNASGTQSRYFTNIIVEGKLYEIVIKLEAAQFRNKGVLLAARDGSIIWLGRDGEVKLLHRASNK